MSKIDLTEYKRILAKAGYDEDDFHLDIEEYTDYTPLRAVCSPYLLYESKFKVTLTHKYSQKQKVYPAERISDWTLNLENDIREGVFE